MLRAIDGYYLGQEEEIVVKNGKMTIAPGATTPALPTAPTDIMQVIPVTAGFSKKVDRVFSVITDDIPKLVQEGRQTLKEGREMMHTAMPEITLTTSTIRGALVVTAIATGVIALFVVADFVGLNPFKRNK